MAKNKLQRIERPATAEEQQRHAAIREEVMQEFPPTPASGSTGLPSGIAAQIRRAREGKGMTWYALAKLAGIANSSTVRDIENGQDAHISDLQAVANALGLRLELVEERV